MSDASLTVGPMLVEDCAASVWTGTSWEVLAAPTRAQDCYFARSDAGVVYLAFWTEDRDSVLHLRVARDTPDGWELLEDLRTVNTSYGEVSSYSLLRFDAAGYPVVLTEFAEEEAWVEIARWNGSEWDDFEALPLGTLGEVWGFEVTPDSRPVISATYLYQADWQRHAVAEWSGDAWSTSVVASRNNKADPELPRSGLALDDTGAPFITRYSDAGLTLLKRVGSRWEPAAPTDDVLESLPRQVLVQAWPDGGEALARYFEDCSWHGWSASHHAGGVSNSEAGTSFVQAVAGDSEVCVAWREALENGDRTLLRCHQW